MDKDILRDKAVYLWNFSMIAVVVSVLLLMWGGVEYIGPYSFYVFLRWFVTATAFLIAYVANQVRRSIWTWVFLIIGILFNPIVPVHLARGTWQVIDFVTGILFLTAIISLVDDTSSWFERICDWRTYELEKKLKVYQHRAQKLIEIGNEFLMPPGLSEDEDKDLRGIGLKSIRLLKSITILARDPANGSACLILSRPILESAIVMRYLIHTNKLNGPEGLPRFKEFFVQAFKEDLDYLRDAGEDVSDLQPEVIDTLFEANKDIMRDATQSWYKPGLVKMMKVLRKGDDLTAKTMSIEYAQASRLVHLNPDDIHFHTVNPDGLYQRNLNNVVLGLRIAIDNTWLLLTDLAELRNDEATDNKLLVAWQE